MWRAATQANLEDRRSRGAEIVGPEEGETGGREWGGRGSGDGRAREAIIGVTGADREERLASGAGVLVSAVWKA